jgi:hypothetical protein
MDLSNELGPLGVSDRLYFPGFASTLSSLLPHSSRGERTVNSGSWQINQWRLCPSKSNMSVKKRKCLSIREKVEIIRELERGEKRTLHYGHWYNVGFVNYDYVEHCPFSVLYLIQVHDVSGVVSTAVFWDKVLQYDECLQSLFVDVTGSALDESNEHSALAVGKTWCRN